MKHGFRWLAAVAVAVCIGVLPVHAQTPTDADLHQQAVVRLLRSADVVDTMKVFAQGYLAHAGEVADEQDARFRMLLSVLVNTDRALVEPFLVRPLMGNLSTGEATALADFFESPTGRKVAGGLNAFGRDLAQDPAAIARQLQLSPSEQQLLAQVFQNATLRHYLQLVTRPEQVRQLLRGVL